MILRTIAILTLGFSFLQAAYPVGKPKTEGYLPVSDIHHLYYATFGNPEGVPVVVIHGGPGWGCREEWTCSFDLEKWFVVMFDQRGVFRSEPFANLEENTTPYLIDDIETLRKHLKIDRWVVFGGSWGSCLGLLYGEAYPDACLGFILRGVFLGRDEDIRVFEQLGMSQQQANALYQRLIDPDPKIQMKAARELFPVDADDNFIWGLAKNFVHYAIHGCFLEPNQILSNIDRIAHLPAIIVHGIEDNNCPHKQAVDLHQHWPSSQLWSIQDAGHSSEDPKIAEALVRATDIFLQVFCNLKN